MDRNFFTKKTNRIVGLIAFMATGGGLIISTANHEMNFYKTEVLIIYGCFFAISLGDHYLKLKERDEKNEAK